MSTKVAIVGSGNIGTDLMFKILRGHGTLELAAMVGIDPMSDGLRRAARMGVPVTSDGVAGLIELAGFDEIDLVFDATSARAHRANAALLEPFGKVLIDLTPAAIGPFVVPTVNLREHAESPNVNMVTCGGQATVPIVAAVAAVTEVFYAEIVASIASRSAGPGTRANIDEFTETTADALRRVGGAAESKAIIILNPAEPPVIMRDTVTCVIGQEKHADVAASVDAMIAEVRRFVPGFRRTQEVQFTPIAPDDPLRAHVQGGGDGAHVVTVLLEIEGAAHYLPAYAGNLDIMTAAAVRVAEELVSRSTPDDGTAERGAL